MSQNSNQDAETPADGGQIVIQPVRHAREGWAEAARALAETGDDELVWPAFSNHGDDSLEW